MVKAVDVKFLVKLTQPIRIFIYFDTNYQSILCFFFFCQSIHLVLVLRHLIVLAAVGVVLQSLCVSHWVAVTILVPALAFNRTDSVEIVSICRRQKFSAIQYKHRI